MRPDSHTRSRRAALILVLLSASGCTVLGGLMGTDETGNDTLSGTAPLEMHLSEMRLMGSGTYQEKLDLFEAIQADYYADASDTNRLRYALAKGVMGHDFSNLAGAFSELQTMLEQPGNLTAAQHDLALVAFRAIENAMILDAESESLRTEVGELKTSNSARSSRTVARLDEIRRRLEAAEVDNERLRGELEQARRQLDAVMSIETSSDRGN